MTDLDRAVARAAAALDEAGIPYMVIGGIANAFWGRVRITQDVDMTIWVDDDDMEDVLRRLSDQFQPLPEHPLEFIRQTRVLPLLGPDGIRIDMAFGFFPFERDAIKRAVVKEMGGRPVHICTAEDLIAHKIISDRPRDWEDVQGIVAKMGGDLDRAYLDPIVEQLAAVLEQPDILERYQSLFP